MKLPTRTRVINSSRVIRELWIHGSLSRAELAKRLDLNKSSMGNIVEDLILQKVIIETTQKKAGPKGGRSAMGLKLNNAFSYAMGIELRSDSYTVIAVDLEGYELFSQTVTQEFSERTFGDELVSLIHQLQETLSWLRRPLIGVGVGISGIIDAGRQIIRRSVSLEFSAPYDFDRNVASQFSFPVLLENDANCGAWGEFVFQRKRQVRNFMFILIEFGKTRPDSAGAIQPTVGIGLGFEGLLYRGSHGKAGEFKSIFNTSPGDTRQIASYPSPSGQTAESSGGKNVLEEYIREVCRNTAFLANTLDIDNAFVGGDVDTFKEFMPAMFAEELVRNSLDGTGCGCILHFTSLGYHAVSFGAAALVLDRVFMDLEPVRANGGSFRSYPLFFKEEKIML